MLALPAAAKPRSFLSMTTSDAPPPSASALQSMRLADRLKLDACFHAVLRERRVLVIHNPHASVLEQHVGLLIERLQASGQVSMEHFASVDSEGLLARMNEALASLSVDEATQPTHAPSHQQIWVVLDTHTRAASDIKLMLQLLRNFPGAGLNAILLLQAKELPQYLADAQGPRLLVWGIEAEPADVPPAASARAGARSSAGDSRTGADSQLRGDASSLTPQTDSPRRRSPKVNLPIGQMWRTVQRGGVQVLGALAQAVRKRPGTASLKAAWPAPRPAPGQAALPTDTSNGPLAGRADGALLPPPTTEEWLARTAARKREPVPQIEATRQTWADSESQSLSGSGTPEPDVQHPGAAPPAWAEPQLSEPETSERQTAQRQTADAGRALSEAVEMAPTPLPEAAQRDLQWLATVPDEAYLLQHALHDDFEQARSSRRGKSHLAKARVLALQTDAWDRPSYAVLTGPYKALERAQASQARHPAAEQARIVTAAEVKTLAARGLQEPAPGGGKAG